MKRSERIERDKLYRKMFDPLSVDFIHLLLSRVIANLLEDIAKRKAEIIAMSRE